MTPLSRRLLLGTALFLLAPAFAQQATPDAAAEGSTAGGYTVELIVFRGGSGGAGEDLSVAEAASAEGDSATGGARNSRVLQRLPASRLKLGALVNRLNATAGYKVVAHAAWVQTASAWGSRVGVPIDEAGLAAQGLSGVVHLERGQYLHLGVNVTLAGTGGTWRMNELRRVKFNERQYYDHPAFGVIAVVSPPSP
ncbi:MAG: CsiV family protein [Steroidobacteraceae bacterium]